MDALNDYTTGYRTLGNASFTGAQRTNSMAK